MSEVEHSEIQRSLGRIEGKLDEVLNRQDRQDFWNTAHDTKDDSRHSGLDTRLIKIEGKENYFYGVIGTIGVAAGVFGWLVPQVIQWIMNKHG